VLSIQSIINFLEVKSTHIISLLAGLVLVVGIFYSIRLGDSLRFLPDEAEYITLAENLVTHRSYSLDGIQPTAYRPPGYPAILSILTLMGGGLLPLRLLNFACLSGCVYLAGRILIQQGFALAAIMGSLLVVAYPVLFYASGTLYPQPLAAFLFLLILKIFTKRVLTALDFVFGGVLFGLLILTVPTFLFAIFIIWGWLLINGKTSLAKSYFLTIAITALILGFWTWRNYSVFGAFFFVSTNSGENFLIGNSEYTTPNAGTTVDISPYRGAAAGMDEVERDRYYQQQAISYISSHPMAAINLYLQKVLNYFNFRNDLVTVSEGSRMRDLIMLLTYGPLIIIFFLRIMLIKRSRPTRVEILFILLYITSAFVTAIFFSRIRFRLPFDFLLIMVVAIAIEKVTRFILDSKISFSRLPILRL
jgi:hypothetical protein